MNAKKKKKDSQLVTSLLFLAVAISLFAFSLITVLGPPVKTAKALVGGEVCYTGSGPYPYRYYGNCGVSCSQYVNDPQMLNESSIAQWSKYTVVRVTLEGVLQGFNFSYLSFACDTGDKWDGASSPYLLGMSCNCQVGAAYKICCNAVSGQPMNVPYSCTGDHDGDGIREADCCMAGSTTIFGTTCPAPASVCGNGTKEGAEECDDGNTTTEANCPCGVTSPTDCICDANCKLADARTRYCGDGTKNGQCNEVCDDGNNINEVWCPCEATSCSNTCNSDCTAEIVRSTRYCGNGEKNQNCGEECDGSDYEGVTCGGLGFNCGQRACTTGTFAAGGCRITGCFDCPVGQICENHVCVAPPADCVVNCSGKICGSDGCYGLCGNCPSPFVCNGTGTACVCPAGRAECGSTCCAVGEACESGVCISPPPIPGCGDGTCDGSETCDTCPVDCGVCPGAGPEVDLDADPERIDAGDPLETDLSWVLTSGDASGGCEADGDWSGIKSVPPGSEPDVDVDSDGSVYRIRCRDAAGTWGDWDSATVLVDDGGGGDECSIVLTKLPVDPTCTRIRWDIKGVIPNTCEASSIPLNAVWNNVDELIVADGDGDASGTTPLLTEPPMCAAAGTTATYILACNCDADATDWQDNPGPPPGGGGEPGTNIYSWITHPGSPFIEEINPGTARFNIFEFFRNLVSGLAGRALAG